MLGDKYETKIKLWFTRKGHHRNAIVVYITQNEDDIVTDTTAPHLVIFDDMLGDKDETKIKLWFTRKGHHRNASVVYITQNLFQQSKASRTISLNAHYMVLFQSPRDKMQINTFKSTSSPTYDSCL